jgi:hypothetical protein
VNGTDWLRSLVRRKPKYAIGGTITATQAPILSDSGCTYTLPPTPPGTDMTEKSAAAPAYIPPSFELAAELTRRADDAARRERVDTNCPCIAIYSTCRCPSTHLQRQT